MFRKILIITLLISISSLGISLPAQDKAKSDQEQDKAQRMPLYQIKRPDIVVEKVWVKTEPWDEPGKIKLKISYTLYNNSSVHTKCCPTEAGKKGWQEKPVMNFFFAVNVQSRSYPNGRYYRLPNGGNTATWLKPYEKQTLWAVEIVPVGAKRQFRVIADFGDWINETKEDNNIGGTLWPLRLKRERK